MVIVTGACGYVGYSIAKELVSRGARVRCLAVPGEDTKHLESLNADIFYGDVTDESTLSDIFSCNEKLAVIHAAGIVSVETRVSPELYNVNVKGTRIIAKLCKEHNAKLVYIGSVDAVPPVNGIVTEAVYDPDAVRGAYAKTKAMAASIVMKSAENGLDACVLLPCAVFGPYDYKGGMVASLLKIYLKKHALPIINGGYEFADVRDIAFAATNAVESGRRGQSYILANQFFELKDIVNEMRSIIGLKKIKFTLPNFIAKLAGTALELFCKLFGKKPLFTAYTITCVNTRVKYSSDLARDELSYNPRPFDETLRDTLNFIEQQRAAAGKQGMFSQFPAPRKPSA